MALVLADRVKDTTTTTGTGAVTLSGSPPAGFQSFGAAVGSGNTTYYTISGGSQWEVGIGTYNSVGTTLTRDVILSSSNAGSVVDLSAGTKDVFVTYPAEKSVNEDAAGNVNISITGNATTATRATNLAAGAAGSVPYQTAANTTAFVATASGVLIGGTTPSFTTTPTLTGTNFTAIPNAALSNSAVTIGSTSVSLGATATTLAGLTSVTLTQDPLSALQAATKQYVDGLVSSGFHYHEPVKYTLVGARTVTYNNGSSGVGATLTNAGAQAAFTPDGIVAQVGDRILVYQQAAPAQNGVYTVTTVGSGSVNWVLTRSTDANTYSPTSPTGLGGGDAFFVTSGNTGGGETYECNNVGSITFGVTAITFVQISDSAIYSAGTGLTLTGTQFSLTNPVATTLGGTGLATFGAANRAIYSTSASILTAGILPHEAGGTGFATYTDGQLLIGKSSDGSLAKGTLTGGTGISISNGSGAITVTNSSPDQVVSLTAGGTTTITGAYPSFNISSADQYVGTVTSVSGAGTVNGITLTGTVTSTGSLTLGGTLSVNLATNVTGTLPVANGGTGATTFSTGAVLVGNGTSAVSSVSPGTSGNVLTSTGTAWVSQLAPVGGIKYTTVRTSNYTAAANDGVQTSTSGGAFTVTLPATPAVGDQVFVIDISNSWATNNLTVGRNGSTIEGLAEDLVCNISNVSVQLVYSGTTWNVFAQVGGASGSVDINNQTTGTLNVSRGGTGATTLTGIVKGNGTSAMTAGSVALASEVTGTLPIANGGTGATTAGAALTALGAAASGANTDITALDQDVTITATGTIAADTIGYRGLPQNSQGGAYTLALADQGKHISITTGGVVIPANGSVAFPVGATIVIFNNSGSGQTISITSDTLRQAGTANTGSRTLAQYGLATCVKVASTTWVISGAGVA